MALSFPTAALLQAGYWRQTGWRLLRRDQYSRQANGIVRGAILGQPLWWCRVSSIPMEADDALALEAVINSHDGVRNPLYWGDQRRLFPRLYPTGPSFTDSGEINTVPTATSLTLKSLPANFQLSVGDYFHFSASSNRRSLHQVMEAVTANGSGVTAAFEVRPPLPSFAVADVAVSFKNPRAKMIILPETFESTSDTLHTVVSFELLQTY